MIRFCIFEFKISIMMISFLIGGAAPVNWIMLVLLLGFLLLMFLLRKKVHAFEWMMHGQAAVAAIAWALGIMLVMGPVISQSALNSILESILWT